MTCFQVISKFSLFEEDIEVIRVVDGSLCPKPMLILTESATWPDLVQTVIDDTKVQKNLPFIDIIILNASRLDYALVSIITITSYSVLEQGLIL